MKDHQLNQLTPPNLLLAVEPWPDPVEGKALLEEIKTLLTRYVVLPNWAAETISLWIVHTYAFELREVCTYLGVESPARRCGKTTLLTFLCELANRPMVAASISSSSLFRAIEELRPTLMIDEADRFLKASQELQGILNAGYHRKTAFVVRVGQQLCATDNEESSAARSLAFFSCWCPKVISQIGRLPDTLADRCNVFRMQRKRPDETCERMRNLDGAILKRQCARFVADNAQAIAKARPEIPECLNDRAADIWEPLLAIADLAGGEWPQAARLAAENISKEPQENSAIGSLLLDIFVQFLNVESDRIFTQTLLNGLEYFRHHSWGENLSGRPLTDVWLAQQLRPFGIRPRTVRMGDKQAKGYVKEDFMDIFRRYVPETAKQALRAELAADRKASLAEAAGPARPKGQE